MRKDKVLLQAETGMKIYRENEKSSNDKEKTEILKRKPSKQEKKRKKHAMQIMATGRKPIACRPKIDVEGGVRSSSWWGREKRLGNYNAPKISLG